MSKCFFKLFLILPWVIDKIQFFFYRRCFACCGRNVFLRPSSSDIKGLENISIGNNVSIPRGSTIYSTHAKLTIMDNVIFGPKPTIITGDHRTDVIGVPIIESHQKLPENDLDVVIEEDVWTGANVVILKGVTVGRGSIIAAGAVVNRSCPPYSIVGGVPGRVIKYRFSIDQIIAHELKIYPPDNRYSRESLEHSRIHNNSSLASEA